MPGVKIHLPGALRPYADQKRQVQVAGSTVGDLLSRLGALYPGLKPHLFDENGIRPFINVFVNEEDIRFLQSLATPVAETDVVQLIPAVSGG